MSKPVYRFYLGVCGRNGSGKSTVAAILSAPEYGFKACSLSDIIREEATAQVCV